MWRWCPFLGRLERSACFGEWNVSDVEYEFGPLSKLGQAVCFFCLEDFQGCGLSVGKRLRRLGYCGHRRSCGGGAGVHVAEGCSLLLPIGEAAKPEEKA